MKKKTTQPIPWAGFRTAYRPTPLPALDAHAIMGAVRHAAAEDRLKKNTLASAAISLPNWVYVTAACLAILCCSGTFELTSASAETKITAVWESSFTPSEIAEGVLLTSTRTYGDF